MDWHTIYKITANNKDGETEIELMEWRDSEPSEVKKLPLLKSGSQKIQWEFSDDYGQGILTRRYKAKILNTNDDDIIGMIESGGYRNYAMKVTVSGQQLFLGQVDSSKIQRPWKTHNKQESYNSKLPIVVTYVFSDSLTKYKNSNVGLLKSLIEDSDHPLHSTDTTPIADLILTYLYRQVARLTITTTINFTSELVLYGNQSGADPDPDAPYDIWPRRLAINLDEYQDGDSIDKLLKSISYGLGVNIGYSFQSNSLAMVSSTSRHSRNNVQNGGDPIEIARRIGPASSDSIMSHTPTTAPIQEINTGSSTSEDGPDKLTNDSKRQTFSPYSGVAFEREEATGWEGQRFSDHIDTIYDIDVYNPTIKRLSGNLKYYREDQDDFTELGAGRFMARYDSTETSYTLGRVVAAQMLNWRIKNRIGFKDATVNKLIDPMITIYYLGPHDGNEGTFRAIRGEWDILAKTTKFDAIQIGHAADESLYDVDIGVTWSDWVWNVAWP